MVAGLRGGGLTERVVPDRDVLVVVGGGKDRIIVISRGDERRGRRALWPTTG